MKEMIKKEYLKEIKSNTKAKLDSGNDVKAINTWAAPVIRYSASIAGWKNSELHNMDKKTRKILNMYQAPHPRSNVGRLYLPRSEVGKGLLCLEECINAEKRCMGRRLNP